MHPKGPVSVTVTPIDAPTSLEELAEKADLIVDGTVAVVLPSISLSNRNPHSIETDSLVSVRKVIGGALPSTVRMLAVAQIGGKIGDAEAAVEDDPLVKPGERYIFFLKRDDQRAVVNTSGSPRYSVVGVWIGKPKVDNEKVRFAGKASGSLRNRDNTDVEVFIAAVEKMRAAKDKRN